MKKIYQTPSTELQTIELQQMIAESFNEQGGSGQVNNVESTSDGLSREFGNFWDEDEDY